MKKLLLWLVPLALLGVAIVVVKRLLDEQQAVDVTGSDAGHAGGAEPLDEAELGGEVSPDLLKILVCPLDRGPLNLSADGKWLVNPRNGYRYPIRDGIPVMLIEEGRKYRDENLITEVGSAA